MQIEEPSGEKRFGRLHNKDFTNNSEKAHHKLYTHHFFEITFTNLPAPSQAALLHTLSQSILGQDQINMPTEFPADALEDHS